MRRERATRIGVCVLLLAAVALTGCRLAEHGRRAAIDAFVKENGVAILMAPPRRGFNLAGYFVPSLAILAAGVILTLVLRRWTRAANRAPDLSRRADDAAPPSPSPSPEELERLHRELDELPL